MPTTVDWPRPSIVVWYTASYVSVPDRDTMPTLPGLWMYPCAAARGASAVAARRGAQAEPQRRGRPRCGLRAAPGPHRHDPNFALAGLDDARAVGANEPCLALLAEDLLHADLRAAAAQRVRARPLQSTGRAWPAAAARHVVLGNALGDADHEVKLRFDALHDSLGGKRRRHVYHRRVGARRVHRLLPHPRAGEAAAASRGRGAARARARVGRTWTELNTGRPRCVVPPFLGVTPPTTCVP